MYVGRPNYGKADARGGGRADFLHDDAKWRHHVNEFFLGFQLVSK